MSRMKKISAFVLSIVMIFSIVMPYLGTVLAANDDLTGWEIGSSATSTITGNPTDGWNLGLTGPGSVTNKAYNLCYTANMSASNIKVVMDMSSVAEGQTFFVGFANGNFGLSSWIGDRVFFRFKRVGETLELYGHNSQTAIGTKTISVDYSKPIEFEFLQDVNEKWQPAINGTIFPMGDTTATSTHVFVTEMEGSLQATQTKVIFSREWNTACNLKGVNFINKNATSDDLVGWTKGSATTSTITGNPTDGWDLALSAGTITDGTKHIYYAADISVSNLKVVMDLSEVTEDQTFYIGFANGNYGLSGWAGDRVYFKFKKVGNNLNFRGHYYHDEVGVKDVSIDYSKPVELEFLKDGNGKWQPAINGTICPMGTATNQSTDVFVTQMETVIQTTQTSVMFGREYNPACTLKNVKFVDKSMEGNDLAGWEIGSSATSTIIGNSADGWDLALSGNSTVTNKAYNLCYTANTSVSNLKLVMDLSEIEEGQEFFVGFANENCGLGSWIGDRVFFQLKRVGDQLNFLGHNGNATIGSVYITIDFNKPVELEFLKDNNGKWQPAINSKIWPMGNTTDTSTNVFVTEMEGTIKATQTKVIFSRNYETACNVKDVKFIDKSLDAEDLTGWEMGSSTKSTITGNPTEGWDLGLCAGTITQSAYNLCYTANMNVSNIKLIMDFSNVTEGQTFYIGFANGNFGLGSWIGDRVFFKFKRNGEKLNFLGHNGNGTVGSVDLSIDYSKPVELEFKKDNNGKWQPAINGTICTMGDETGTSTNFFVTYMEGTLQATQTRVTFGREYDPACNINVKFVDKVTGSAMSHSLSPVSYDLAKGNYLLTGTKVTVDGQEVATGTTLNKPGDYTIVREQNYVKYTQKVSLYRLGDVDLNGTAGEPGDYTALQKMLNGIKQEYKATKATEYAADLDNDGNVGFKDLELFKSVNEGANLQDILDKYHVASLAYDYLGGDDVMPIVGFNGPYEGKENDLLTDEVLQLIKDSGVNMISSTQHAMGQNNVDAIRAIKLAEKYGLGYYMRDFDINAEIHLITGEKNPGASLSGEEFMSYLNRYASYANFLGINVIDEPAPNSNSSSDNMINRQLQYYDGLGSKLNTFTNLTGYVNLYPSWASQATTGTTYANYVSAVKEGMNAKMLSVDHYPFNDTRGTAYAYKYFESLWTVRQAAGTEIPWWGTIQAGGDFDNDGTGATNSALLPTKAETFWHVNTTLAFGAKGIQWFPLVQPEEFSNDNSADGKDYNRNGLVSANGVVTTPFYEYAKEINKHIAAVDDVLMKAKSTGIMWTGSEAGSNNNLGCSGVTRTQSTDMLKDIQTSNGDGAIVGCFDYRDTEAFYVVNYDVDKSETITLTFANDCNYRVVQNAVTTYGSTTDTKCVLNLTPGDGVLVVIEDTVQEFSASEYATYRSTTGNRVPDAEPGYIFSGWFSDAACKKAITTDTITGTAYAKFVSKDVLTVKAQITAGTKSSSERSDIRFVTTVDNLNYKTIGFEITPEGRQKKTITSKNVYHTLYYVGSNSDFDNEYKPNKEFSTVSTSFYSYTYRKIPTESFDVKFVVTPYWITQDGTTVYGETAVKSVSMGINK